MFHRLAAGMIAGFFVLIAACSAVDKAAEHADVSRLAVKAGTLKYIEAEDDRSQRANDVQAFIERARQHVDGEAESTVDALADRVREEVRWDRLELSEQLLVDELIASIEAKLKERIGDGPLSEEDRLRIEAVLDWAYDAAGLYAQ